MIKVKLHVNIQVSLFLCVGVVRDVRILPLVFLVICLLYSLHIPWSTVPPQITGVQRVHLHLLDKL